MQENLQIVGMENIFRAGFKEFMRLRQQGTVDSEAIMEGAQRAMRVAYSREEEKLEKHLPFLATVGSVSPYIGLFGTVIGIMNAFLGIGEAGSSSIAAMAPGIAEALTTTALGLAVAIPAVVFYNQLLGRLRRLILMMESFSSEFVGYIERRYLSVARDGRKATSTTGLAAARGIP